MRFLLKAAFLNSLNELYFNTDFYYPKSFNLCLHSFNALSLVIRIKDKQVVYIRIK